MLEDTFVHRYVDALLEAVFGSESRFKHDWEMAPCLEASGSESQKKTSIQEARAAATLAKKVT
ncbi:hypothetical protein DFQ28_001834 [Apophysomyces sp. BC1034]|nr:hypothetical protein DFQ29_007824 [Apophysomyces sp. BC1021]KAG0194033.1 hypothetical protein DFQ28_001834 [Apophysomyces sp. BC1034]